VFAVEYTFSGNAGDIVSIELTSVSGDLDSYLSLRDPAGFEIEFNDDSNPGVTLDSAIQNFELPENGTYTIVATRFSQQAGTTSGDFDLSLTVGAVATATPVPSVGTPSAPVGGELHYGNTVQGTIGGDTFEVVYTFTGRQGDDVTISMIALSGNLDPYLILSSPQGSDLIFNDDSEFGSGLDSEITDFTLPENGVYSIHATRFSQDVGSSEGDFRLSLLSSTAGPVATTGSVLHYGDTAVGEISDDQFSVEYTFEARAGDVIGIQLTRISGDLDTLVVLRGPAGSEIASNDDDPRGSNVDSYLRDFEIPADGVYTILATRFNRDLGASAGTFELRLERVSGVSALPVVTNATAIQLNTPTTGAITNDIYYQEFIFPGEAGTAVTVTMDTSGNLDPYLILLDPAGREVAYNDDRAGDDYNSTLDNVQLAATGDYTVVATRFNRLFGTSEGEFSLVVQGSPGGRTQIAGVTRPIAMNSTERGTISEDFPDQVYTFEARAGDVITITMQSTDGAVDPLIILEDHFGSEIERNDDDQADGNLFDLDAGIRDLTIPADGFYTIDANSVDGVGDYDLTLTRVASGAPGAVTPIYAPINVTWSRGTLADDSGYIYYAAGDWANEGVDEGVIYSIVTYNLPVLAEGKQVQVATLRLDSCEFGNGNPFTTFGNLRIALNARFSSNESIDQVADPVAPVVTEISECQTVDITDVVTQAYVDGQRIVQLRWEFIDARAINNGLIDGVIFTHPRLEILTN
jgi:hypothetical protein